MNTPLHTRARHPGREERGWVVVAALILASLAASVTVTWARHAVLAKGTLEMENGASSAEEAARSGLNRAREKMRQGNPPGTIDAGTEDVIITEDNNLVTTERECHEADDYDKRRIETRSRKAEGGDMQEEACIKARAEVVPASEGRGKKTRLTCDASSSVMMAGLLTIISGDVTYEDTEIAGLMMLEPGSTLTLEDVTLRGTIITRAGACEDEPVQEGANRPHVRLIGDVRLLAGTELPDVAVVGPDCRITTDTSSKPSRVEVRGMTVCDEIDLEESRGNVRGMVVHETSAKIGSNVKRPEHGRGTENWSDSLRAGAEKVTRMSFPATGFLESEMDQMESCNAGNH